MIDFSQVDVSIVAAFGIEMEKLFEGNTVYIDYRWGATPEYRWYVETYEDYDDDHVSAEDETLLGALRKLAVELAAAEEKSGGSH